MAWMWNPGDHDQNPILMDGFEIVTGKSPFITAAIHDGHHVRDELHEWLSVPEHERIREEDPYTSYLAEVSESRIIGKTSRFEVDLNRPREKAVYRKPADAWGMHVWRKRLPDDLVERSLAKYDAFYAAVENFLIGTITRFGYFVVLDIHSYNHRRDRDREPAPGPEINIGTSSLPDRWEPSKDAFVRRLRQIEINDHIMDVRENINFKGGEFSKWINENFGRHGFSLAIEFKKLFMDEWTGRVDIHYLNSLRTALVKTIPAIKASVQPTTT